MLTQNLLHGYMSQKNICNLIYDELSKQTRNVCERALLTIVETQCLMPHERFITQVEVEVILFGMF